MTFSEKSCNLIYSEPVYLTDCNKNNKEKINSNYIYDTNTSIELNNKNIKNESDKLDKSNKLDEYLIE